MLAEAIMDHNEIKIIKFPKNQFKGNHWKLNIESIEEIKDVEETKDIKLLIKETAGILKDKNINPVKWQREIREEYER